MIQLTTTVSSCATSSSSLDFGTSLSHSSDLPELVEASARRSSPLDKPNVRESLEVEGVSLESSRSRRIEEKYPGPNEDPNCPFPTLVCAETFWSSRLNVRSLETTLELCSTLCETWSWSSSTSASSISIPCDLGVPLKRSTSHAGEKKSLTVSITPYNATRRAWVKLISQQYQLVLRTKLKTTASFTGKELFYKLR